jgi:hypothetical protein
MASPLRLSSGIPGLEVIENPRVTAQEARAFNAQRPPTAAPVTPTAGANAAYKVGKTVGTGLRALAGPATVGAAAMSGFGDFKVNDPGVDSSAMGTLRELGKGNFSGAWDSAKKGAVETGLDLASGLAKTGDIFLPGQPLSTSLRDRVNADLGPTGTIQPGAANPAAAQPAAAAPFTQTDVQRGGAMPAEAPLQNNVTRNGNVYSGTDISGTPTINGSALRKGGMVSGTGDGTFGYGGGPDLSGELHAARLAAVARGEDPSAVSTGPQNLSVMSGSVRGLRFADEVASAPTADEMVKSGMSPAQANAALAARGAAAASERNAARNAGVTMRGQDIQARNNEIDSAVSLRGQDVQTRGQDMTAKTAAASARAEQANKDRAYQLDVQKFGVDVAEKNRAAASTADEAVQKSLESRFRTKDAKGNDVADTAKAGQYRAALSATLPQLITQLEAKGTPEALAKAKQIRSRGASALEPGDHDGLQQLFDTRERMRESRGMGPNAGTFAESDNLLDYKQTGTEKRMFGGDRVKTNAGSVSVNDLRYADGPANALLPDMFRTESRNLTRGLRMN